MATRRKLNYNYGPKHVLRIIDCQHGTWVHLLPKKLPRRGGFKYPSWRFANYKAATKFAAKVAAGDTAQISRH